MTFNLIHEPWMPMRRQKGKIEYITPWQITDSGPGGDDPFVAPAAVRPDFNGALIQFLIGLVQTLRAPEDNSAWRHDFIHPPKPTELKEAFEQAVEAFNLDGPGPRFMQDFELLNEGQWPVSKLLLGYPGENTRKLNIDHFIKRGYSEEACPSCLALSLFIRQTCGPGFTGGHRNSLRGSGPLTTVVMGWNLWQTIWLNIFDRKTFLGFSGNKNKKEMKHIFPWLSPTYTSEKDQTVNPDDVHPAQLYWTMSKRLRINFEELSITDSCPLCGRKSDRIVAWVHQKKYGCKYEENLWQHPLSPAEVIENGKYKTKQVESGGISYRHWLGLVLGDQQKKIMPALTVSEFLNNRQNWPGVHEILRKMPRIWAFGFEAVPRQDKVRNWSEGIMPLVLVRQDQQNEFELVTSAMVLCSREVAEILMHSVKKAWFRPKAKVKNRPKAKIRNPTFINSLFWQITEPVFYQTLHQLHLILSKGIDVDSNEILDLKRDWLKVLNQTAENLFDRFSQNSLINLADPKRIALAWNEMHRLMSAKSRKMKALLELPNT